MNKPAHFLKVFVLCCFIQASAENYASSLMEDLLLLKKINEDICWRFPVHHNHILVGGYMMMPSSRIGREGEAEGQFEYSPPYSIWSARFTPLENFEASINYRILHGVDDPVLTPRGFGERSDKGANIKFVILHPEDSSYCLPGVSLGLEDFMGTKTYNASYIVLTQVFKCLNAELTLGYGDRRIQGFFGGGLWMPFYDCEKSHFKHLSLFAEYDASQYSDPKWEPNPNAREQKTHWNLGLGYRFWDFSFNLCWVRGKELAVGASASGNIGTSSGLLPKTQDPLPYTRPLIHTPICQERPIGQLIEQLACAFAKQKIKLLDMQKCSSTHLSLVLENEAWIDSDCFKKRVVYLIGALIPEPFEKVTVYVETDGILSHSFTIPVETARDFLQCKKGYFEVAVQAPNTDICAYPKGEILFKQKMPLFCPYIQPDIHNFFGSSKGKYKYSIGIAPGVDGYLPGKWYYNIKTGLVLFSDLHGVGDFDVLNPSQIVNVRSDSIRFYKQRGLAFHELYVQKNWNLGWALFSRFSVGYFEQMYAGVATELLFYPVNSCFAFGIEGAALIKREPSGFELTGNIRKLVGLTPTYPHLCPVQYFATLYYQSDSTGMEASIKGGQFLARDMGARFEVTKTFQSGIKVGLWYTYTNAVDILNGDNYHDKGVIISIPFDLFSTCSRKKRIEQRMAAWQRDVGQVARTGKTLYNTLRIERFR